MLFLSFIVFKNKMTTSESEKICVICLEGGDCYKMSTILNYIKQCECNCVVHSKCLYEWHKMAHNKCLICKKLVYIKDSKLNKYIDPDVYKFQQNVVGALNFVLLLIICYIMGCVTAAFYLQFHKAMNLLYIE